MKTGYIIILLHFIAGISYGSHNSITSEKEINETIAGTIVWTEPAFPTQQDDITLYYDANEGNGALAGFQGTVYAHAGLITNQSTNPNDWKYVIGNWGTEDPHVEMTAEGNGIYSLEYNIENFHGIPAGEIVEKLAFVFRNANGTIVGRESDGSDIFYNIYQNQDDLLIELISPASNSNIFYLGDSFNVQFQINKDVDVIVTNNDLEIFSEYTSNVNIKVNTLVTGMHELIIIASDSTDTSTIAIDYIVLDENGLIEDAPSSIVNGVNYQSDRYIFRLTAPLKQNVFFLCPENEFNIDLDFQMKKSVDGSYFWIELPDSIFENGKNIYQYLVDGNIKIADPFSTVVLDPWNDGNVPFDVLAELPDYPTQLTDGFVTPFDLQKNDFDWQVDNFEKPKKSNLIIYELMMRDFLADKNYKSLLDTLDYLKNLGINAVELMPIHEFEGNQSWGYNPSFHMAVDKYYGSRDQLRDVIDACHTRGIAVILDVVFNHAFSQSPLCQLYWNSTNFRPAADNPYLNETARHPFNVGYDFNHESIYTKEWVKQNLTYWIEEFKFDGFRFDLSKGLTQTFSGNNADAMAQHDFTRIAILQDYAEHIWSLDSTSYVIMEHFAVNSEEQVMSNLGMMMWSNMTHEFTEAAMGYSSHLSGADYTSRDFRDPNIIAYMESHDEERMAYKLINFGNSQGDYNTRDLSTAMERIVLASNIYFSIPGPKMVWQFGEVGFDYSINRCVNGTIDNDCRLDPKPIRWDYFENENRRSTYDKLAALLWLRKNYEVFQTKDFNLDDRGNYLKSVFLRSDNLNALSISNFDVVERTMTLPFSLPTNTEEEVWYDYYTGQTYIVNDHNPQSITLQPGEYRLYLNQEIVPPGGYFSSTSNQHTINTNVFPMPVSRGQDLYVSLEHVADINKITLSGVNGSEYSIVFQNNSSGIYFNTANVVPGFYLLNIHTVSNILSTKVIIIPE